MTGLKNLTGQADYGNLVDRTDHCGRTPLHAAALKGHRDAVKLLLDGGADCDKVASMYGGHKIWG